MEDVSDKLFKYSSELENLKKYDSSTFDTLDKVCEQIGKSWSGSWLGYHSRIYYDGFVAPPPGCHFSQEWGFHDVIMDGTTGDWKEYIYDEVIKLIFKRAGNPDLTEITKKSRDAAEKFDDLKSEILSTIASVTLSGDKFTENIIEKINGSKIFSESDFIKYFQPTGKFMSRDMKAIGGGVVAPPHLAVSAKSLALISPFTSCDNLAKQTRRLASHLQNVEKNNIQKNRVGTNIFIGHGRSKVWRELKDFVQDRLQLPWDEFNRVPVAGVTNIARLSQMLDNAAFAFLIMTAEDEQCDGKLHARMNVVHEVGLFQGRLGFEKAIVLLEEGCEEFSNIQGLGQIRFPQGKIESIFEEIRLVLEREDLV